MGFVLERADVGCETAAGSRVDAHQSFSSRKGKGRLIYEANQGRPRICRYLLANQDNDGKQVHHHGCLSLTRAAPPGQPGMHGMQQVSGWSRCKVGFGDTRSSSISSFPSPQTALHKCSVTESLYTQFASPQSPCTSLVCLTFGFDQPPTSGAHHHLSAMAGLKTIIALSFVRCDHDMSAGIRY